MKRTRADLIQAWLLKAHKDVVFAREALGKGEDYTDIACFHAQQAAEKTLKAYLVWLGVEFPKTHVLEDLLDLIARQDTTLEDWRAALQPLTPFAVEARYPEFSRNYSVNIGQLFSLPFAQASDLSKVKPRLVRCPSPSSHPCPSLLPPAGEGREKRGFLRRRPAAVAAKSLSLAPSPRPSGQWERGIKGGEGQKSFVKFVAKPKWLNSYQNSCNSCNSWQRG